jgi:hypothetical protein
MKKKSKAFPRVSLGLFSQGAFTLSSKVPNSSSKKADIAALLGANLSNTRRANSSSIDFAQ